MTKMKVVNLVIVYHVDGSSVLMCHRQSEPYKGLYNFVGGKLEANESDLDAAYRELFEETGITKNDIQLTSLFTTRYPIDQIELQVYYGKLAHSVTLVEEKHPLSWQSLNQNFSDDSRFAGQGNIKHMLDLITDYEKSESKQSKS